MAMLQWMKDQSKQRRLLLREQFGVQEDDQLCQVLGTEHERDQFYLEQTFLDRTKTSPLNHPIPFLDEASTAQSPTGEFGYSSTRLRLIARAEAKLNPIEVANQSKNSTPQSSKSLSSVSRLLQRRLRTSLTQAESKANKKRSQSSSEVKEQLKLSKYEYKGSSTFLKGTQSANPHNDYCQHYVDTGQRPQNFIRDYELHDRFEEYPKLKELIKLKDDLISKTASPPMYLKCDLTHPGDLRGLNCKFDVILIDPPLEEYQRTQGVTKTKFWSWDRILQLDIDEIAAQRSFIFLWCGSSDGLDLGRKCLRRWGFRRCEDICWIKTNKNNIGHNKNLEPKAIFQRTKEHCLMGIKGTVRRSTDGDFIHSNVDIDLIISEEPPYGTLYKPDEIFHIIEHFCLGRRRLHLFGRDSSIRPGWLTVGPDLTNSNFNADLYKDNFSHSEADYLTGCTDRIEVLRPKSPPPKINSMPNAQGGPHGFRKRF